MLRIIPAVLLGIWLVLILFGKGGFVHVLLLTAVGIAVIEAARTYRSQVRS